MNSSKQLSDFICRELNVMYIVYFMIELVNIYAYYHIHDISFIQARYAYWIFSSAITILLIVFVINEERDSPTDPIVTESVSYFILYRAQI